MLDRALVLAAGMATRLHPLTLQRPKCLLEVAGQTIIGRLVGQLAAAGVEDMIVASHGLAGPWTEATFDLYVVAAPLALRPPHRRTDQAGSAGSAPDRASS